MLDRIFLQKYILKERTKHVERDVHTPEVDPPCLCKRVQCSFATLQRSALSVYQEPTNLDERNPSGTFMSTKSNHSVLFLGKENDVHCQRAAEFAKRNISDVLICLGKWGDPLPEKLRDWEGEYVISYLSRWIVPQWLIDKAAVAAINFHPASPDYPGIGCNNFALYENAAEYGATCHHMDATVDTGKIVAVKRFPVFASDDVDSLLKRTYDFQLALYYEVMGAVLKNESLPESAETWTRRPFTRKEFNKLSIITPDLSDEEVRRRVRATSYGTFQPYLEIAGNIFELKPKKDD